MRDLALLWGIALGLAVFGTALLFDASAGANWGIWTLGATAAIAVWSRRVGAGAWSALSPLLALAVALGAGAAVTADGCFHALIACAVAALLAMAVLLAGDPQWDRMTASFMLWAPIVTPLYALAEAIARALGLIELVATPGNRPRLRGALLALPIVGLFGLILANADPVLATLRDDLADALERLAFVPRLAFFSTILAGAVGAGGLIVRRAVVRTPGAPGFPTPRLAVRGSSLRLTEPRLQPVRPARVRELRPPSRRRRASTSQSTDAARHVARSERQRSSSPITGSRIRSAPRPHRSESTLPAPASARRPARLHSRW